MKIMFALLAMTLSLSAFADGEGGGGYGSEDVINAGGGTTVVGGGCVAKVIGSGENQEIVYEGQCNTAPTVTPVASDYYTVFPTVEAARAHCDIRDNVVARYNWRLEIVGYVCQEAGNDDNGSSN